MKRLEIVDVPGFPAPRNAPEARAIDGQAIAVDNGQVMA